MERSDPRYQAYVEILKEELIPAMGCTEPIALAYAAAKAREVLGMLPESVQLQVSGSIIKNVKSVIVPNTGHLKGMEAAVAAGIIAGSADRELEVISEVSICKQCVCLCKHHLRCKILVGNTQTLELHPVDAGLASPNEKVYGSNTLSAIGK